MGGVANYADWHRVCCSDDLVQFCNVGCADKADLGFSRFADAAFVRTRGFPFDAVQRMSPKKPFTVVELAQTETAHSLLPDRTSRTQDKAVKVTVIFWAKAQKWHKWLKLASQTFDLTKALILCPIAHESGYSKSLSSKKYEKQNMSKTNLSI